MIIWGVCECPDTLSGWRVKYGCRLQGLREGSVEAVEGVAEEAEHCGAEVADGGCGAVAPAH